MTLKNNRAPVLSDIKLCASFHHYRWIQTGVTVRKRLSSVLTSVTLTFDLWPWPFAWTSFLSMVITPENFMIIRWWEHSQKGVRQTDGRTYWIIHRAAWSQLKMYIQFSWKDSINTHGDIGLVIFCCTSSEYLADRICLLFPNEKMYHSYNIIIYYYHCTSKGHNVILILLIAF